MGRGAGLDGELPGEAQVGGDLRVLALVRVWARALVRWVRVRELRSPLVALVYAPVLPVAGARGG